jgi:hypothetical protein
MSAYLVWDIFICFSSLYKNIKIFNDGEAPNCNLAELAGNSFTELFRSGLY